MQVTNHMVSNLQILGLWAISVIQTDENTVYPAPKYKVHKKVSLGGAVAMAKSVESSPTETAYEGVAGSPQNHNW